MASLVKKLPKDWTGDKDWRYNVIFLRHTIDSKDIVKALNAKPEIEQVTYVPGTLLWSAHVNDLTRTAMAKLASHKLFQRSEERRVGKECRSRRSPDRYRHTKPNRKYMK